MNVSNGHDYNGFKSKSLWNVNGKKRLIIGISLLVVGLLLVDHHRNNTQRQQRNRQDRSYLDAPQEGRRNPNDNENDIKTTTTTLPGASLRLGSSSSITEAATAGDAIVDRAGRLRHV